jgi:hypothetical protein
MIALHWAAQREALKAASGRRNVSLDQAAIATEKRFRTYVNKLRTAHEANWCHMVAVHFPLGETFDTAHERLTGLLGAVGDKWPPGWSARGSGTIRTAQWVAVRGQTALAILRFGFPINRTYRTWWQRSPATDAWETYERITKDIKSRLRQGEL